ncbi:Adiponectin receptor protein-like [Oopsacas minuta]|uniref:Adiponectin receptor protein-like n=1 Tax=Oopsacas minuta TaxID=111878 RepID=A0AAV7KCM1_9METZ|nr:Adiponectin receptor protein-like [Oopsacas minuta]
MEDELNYTAVKQYPPHLTVQPVPSTPLEDSSCDPDSDQSLDNKKNDTGSGYNYSDDCRPKGLGDAWIDIPMSQAIEFIPVLTPGDIKDIARHKSKVVVARINEQIITHKERMHLHKEKMSQSLATKKERLHLHREKMSQSLATKKERMHLHREKMSQSLATKKERMHLHREKMSQSLATKKERMSQSLTQKREKMTQQREKMSQNFNLQKVKVSQSFTDRRERVSQSFSLRKKKITQRRVRMSQSLTYQRERMSQSLSSKKDKMTLKSKQVREHMSVGAARVHQMRDQVVTQMKSRFGTGLSTREFDLDIPISPLREINTSPDDTPVLRRSRILSQSCPNLYPLPLTEDTLEEVVTPRKDDLSIYSFATSVSARSSESDMNDSESYYSDSSYSDIQDSFIFSIPNPDIIPEPIGNSEEVEIPRSRSASIISDEEPCPLPFWAIPKHSFPLLKYPQLPDWYKDNECIRKYYRPPLRSFKKCIKSIGYWHTESGNIWSHLLGMIIFLIFVPHFAYTMFIRSFDSDFSWPDPSVITVFIISAVLCLLLSTCFHTFMCHSNKVFVLCLRIDYCGIAFLIIGSYIPWFYYLFYCMRIAQIGYISTCVILGVTAIVTMIAPFFNRPKFRIFRALLFGCVGSFGVIPAMHAIGVQGLGPAMSLGGMALMFCGGMFYIVGAGIYAIRFPERIFPGKCDLLLQSHTIFHIFVLIAATFHYFSLLRIQEIRILRGGYCNPGINI